MLARQSLERAKAVCAGEPFDLAYSLIGGSKEAEVSRFGLEHIKVR